MAGIGFELKRLFERKGMLASIRAYSYALVVCAGPMLLGFTLLILATLIVSHAGVTRHERELLVSMINHTQLASLAVSSLFSMLATRFCADMIYEHNYERLMPSFYGSVGLMLVVGGIAYGVFLYFSEIWMVYRIICWVFFMILVVTWTQMNYLSMLKDFRSIMLCFLSSIAIALVSGCLMIYCCHMMPILSMLIAVCIGYGVMMVSFFIIISRYLPKGQGTALRFLEWYDRTPEIGFIGFLMFLGMFGHILVMWWVSPLRVQIDGLLFCAPGYDVPAIISYFSILPTTVFFTTSVETRFYPKYRTYFGLFSNGGSINEIREAEEKMLGVLCEELGSLTVKQVFTTLLFIIFGTIVIPQLPLGFDSRMFQTFRCLCVGYAFYAVGNCFVIVAQYFSDLRGALWSTLLFALLSSGLTLLFTYTVEGFYGLGFILGCAIFAVVALVRLCWYLGKLEYHILVQQPMFTNTHSGFFSAIVLMLEKRAADSQQNEPQFMDSTR